MKINTLSKILITVSAVILMLSACQESTKLASVSSNTVSISKTERQKQRPNILLIMAEDLSPRIGAYGDKVANTPTLDQLAKDGILYENVFTTAGVCAPSRSAFIMGVHQQTLGTMHMRTQKNPAPIGHVYEAVTPSGVKAFPELLRAAGYYTVNNFKTDYQVGTPFTIWDKSHYSGHWTDAPKDKPFFSMITLMPTHESYTWDPDHKEPTKLGLMIQNRNLDFFALRPNTTNPFDVEVPPYYPDTLPVRDTLAHHYNNINWMDNQVREILAELEQKGIADNTIVIWTTDHGDGLPRAKRSLYDTGTKVPLIIRFPDGYGAGEHRAEMVSFVDLAPTILSLAGADIPAFIQGKNIIENKWSKHQRGFESKYIYSAVDRLDEEYERSRAVRDHRFKYIRNYVTDKPIMWPLYYREQNLIAMELRKAEKAGTLTPEQSFIMNGPRPSEELYDTKNDPWEVNNLATNSAYKNELIRLRNAHLDWQARAGDLGAMPEAKLVDEIMWPKSTQPTTPAPKLVSIETNTTDDETVTFHISNTNPDASIGYRIHPESTKGLNKNQNTSARFYPWQLYTSPVTIKEGEVLESKAIRYGYKESVVVSKTVLNRHKRT